VKSVPSFTQPIVFDFYNAFFTPRNMVFSAAGNLDHDRFGGAGGRALQRTRSQQRRSVGQASRAGDIRHHHAERKKSLEQVQLCLGVPAPPVDSPTRFAVYLLNSILGGGMSSRLFRPSRGPRTGLLHLLRDQPLPRHGALSIYAGTSAGKTRR